LVFFAKKAEGNQWELDLISILMPSPSKDSPSLATHPLHLFLAAWAVLFFLLPHFFINHCEKREGIHPLRNGPIVRYWASAFCWAIQMPAMHLRTHWPLEAFTFPFSVA
jgi:hypothetical protein